MDTCPSTFTLDDREIHGAPADDAVRRHLATCTRCAARVASRAILDQRFQARFREPLWRRVQAARPRRSWWRAGLLAPALALTAAVVLWRADTAREQPRTPAAHAGYSAAKGATGVRVDGRRAGRTFTFDDATPASAGDEIQVTVAAAHPDQRYVIVGSVDGTRRFSPFYPATLDGHSVALPAPGQPLGPPIVLDAAPGPERIVIVRSSRPLSVGAVAGLAEAAAAHRERFAIPGDGDAHADVQWLTLRKAAPAEKAPDSP